MGYMVPVITVIPEVEAEDSQGAPSLLTPVPGLDIPC